MNYNFMSFDYLYMSICRLTSLVAMSRLNLYMGEVKYLNYIVCIYIYSSLSCGDIYFGCIGKTRHFHIEIERHFISLLKIKPIVDP